MKKLFFLIFTLSSIFAFSQEDHKISGLVVNAENDTPIDNVHVVNLNQVIGTITNSKGKFEIYAKANDTLYFSFIGFKSIKIRVTNDMLRFQNTKIELTELAYALEEVVVKPFQLTGYLEIDVKNIPINDSPRYSISGLPRGYEAGNRSPKGVSKALEALFNPADFLNNLFGNKSTQMKKLRKMKRDNEIRDLLSSKYDRQTLMALLQVERIDIDDILRNCNYSDSFIKTANDLQILDAISGCYEEYKVLNRNN